MSDAPWARIDYDDDVSLILDQIQAEAEAWIADTLRDDDDVTPAGVAHAQQVFGSQVREVYAAQMIKARQKSFH